MSQASAQLISITCEEVKELLLEKNKKYGDSALNPCRIFSKASSVEQILVRIDDKLSRIQKGAGLLANDEDVLMDLIGYLILLRVAMVRREEDRDMLEVFR
jgi:hypothetical protein